jgi:hypothetical protein
MREALAAMQANSARALTDLALLLPESERPPVLREALAAARNSPVQSYCASALVEVALLLPESERPPIMREALAVARAISEDFTRSQTLAELNGAIDAKRRNNKEKGILIPLESIYSYAVKDAPPVELPKYLRGANTDEARLYDEARSAEINAAFKARRRINQEKDILVSKEADYTYARKETPSVEAAEDLSGTDMGEAAQLYAEARKLGFTFESALRTLLAAAETARETTDRVKGEPRPETVTAVRPESTLPRGLATPYSKDPVPDLAGRITRAHEGLHAASESNPGDDLKLSSKQVAAVIADSTLGRLQARYEKLLETKFPANGLKDVKQAREAAKLSVTYGRLRDIQIELGLEPQPKDSRVVEAERLKAAFYRKSQKTEPTRASAPRSGRGGAKTAAPA